jgi:hypothetical protein
MHNLVLLVHAHGFDPVDEAFLCLGRKPNRLNLSDPTSLPTTTPRYEASWPASDLLGKKKPSGPFFFPSSGNPNQSKNRRFQRSGKVEEVEAS